MHKMFSNLMLMASVFGGGYKFLLHNHFYVNIVSAYIPFNALIFFGTILLIHLPVSNSFLL